MTTAVLSRSVAIGAMTGIRSMSGLALLAWRRGGPLTAIAAVMALGEMIADKLPDMGDRTDTLPLAGRVVIGGFAGSYIAGRGRGSVAGAVLGATSALITAHLATQARRQLDVPNAAGGLLEDAATLALWGAVSERRRLPG